EIRLRVRGFLRLIEGTGAQHIEDARVCEPRAQIDDAIAHDRAIACAAVGGERCEFQDIPPLMPAKAESGHPILPSGSRSPPSRERADHDPLVLTRETGASTWEKRNGPSNHGRTPCRM